MPSPPRTDHAAWLERLVDDISGYDAGFADAHADYSNDDASTLPALADACAPHLDDISRALTDRLGPVLTVHRGGRGLPPAGHPVNATLDRSVAAWFAEHGAAGPDGTVTTWQVPAADVLGIGHQSEAELIVPSPGP